MMKNVKKFLIYFFSFFALFAVILSIPSKPEPVSADTGPKPTTEIRIKNLEKSDYIVAYATKFERYGPHISFVPGDEIKGKTYFGSAEDLTLLYNTVTLPENFMLLDISYFFKDSSDFVVKSGYMWPSEFMLVIYNKVNTKYYLTEETKTYAFNSYFECDMKDYSDGKISLSKPVKLDAKYQYGKEIGGFFLRLVVTLGIELLLALAFKFTKKSFLIIAVTNAATQIGLNVALNLTAHFNGKNPWLIMIYAIAELAIVAIEAIIFTKFCERKDNRPKTLIPLYAIAANILSFGLGMLLWYVL